MGRLASRSMVIADKGIDVCARNVPDPLGVYRLSESLHEERILFYWRGRHIISMRIHEVSCLTIRNPHTGRGGKSSYVKQAMIESVVSSVVIRRLSRGDEF